MEQQGVDDLVLLPQVTEDGICGNLLKRFRSDLIYVRLWRGGRLRVSELNQKYLQIYLLLCEFLTI
jgi:hypothetical protein